MVWDFAPQLKHCPKSVVDGETLGLVEEWRRWAQLGAMPAGGSDIMAQPGWFLDLVECCERAKAQALAEREEKQRQKLNADQKVREYNLRRLRTHGT